MKELKARVESDKLIIELIGHIDATNAKLVEDKLMKEVDSNKGLPVVIDASKLEYISSSGLRFLLHLKKVQSDLKVVNVTSVVYEIFEMTGFNQIINIEKAFKEISVEGCEEVGRGANGIVYRVNQDNVVKVYKDANALEEIRHEREVARKALIWGIPTAISYDIVKVNGSYGSVFELLNAKSFSQILDGEPDKFDWCVEEYTNLLKKIHSTMVPENELPNIKETGIGWVKYIEDYLPEDAAAKLLEMFENIPDSEYMIHGDYHTKNVEYVDGEVLIIDMDTLAVGHPVFELAAMYNVYLGFSEDDHSTLKPFLGIEYDLAEKFLDRVMRKYLNTDDDTVIKEVMNKARIVGYTKMLRRIVKRNKLETEDGKRRFELFKGELLELLEVTDELDF